MTAVRSHKKISGAVLLRVPVVPESLNSVVVEILLAESCVVQRSAPSVSYTSQTYTVSDRYLTECCDRGYKRRGNNTITDIPTSSAGASNSAEVENRSENNGC